MEDRKNEIVYAVNVDLSQNLSTHFNIEVVPTPITF